MLAFRSVFWLLVIAILDKESQGVSLAEDLTLTTDQKKILEIFKVNVGPKLTKEYQHSDIYLIRWLRARNFDLRQAEQLLIQHLEWRREQNMDTILEEDWSDIQDEFPYSTGGYDNEGRPIVAMDIADWDLRRGVLSGKRERMIRWSMGMLEYGTSRVRELQAEGKNVTQWNFIMSMQSFNLIQHGCVQCMPIYAALVNGLENHFPGSIDKAYILNAPGVFEVVLTLIRPLMSPLTRAALEVFGNDESAWRQKVFKDIKRDQLPIGLGGTRRNEFLK